MKNNEIEHTAAEINKFTAVAASLTVDFYKARDSLDWRLIVLFNYT